jgi:hypothetical protein
MPGVRNCQVSEWILSGWIPAGDQLKTAAEVRPFGNRACLHHGLSIGILGATPTIRNVQPRRGLDADFSRGRKVEIIVQPTKRCSMKRKSRRRSIRRTQTAPQPRA